MNALGKWYDSQDAGGLSLVALLLIATSQIFTIIVFKEANVKAYIDSNKSYIADITFDHMQPGRGGRALYRLKYQIIEGKKSISCDVPKVISSSSGVHIGDRVRVTPINGNCQDLYLTDFGHNPIFDALCGLVIMLIASILLVLSAIKLKLRVDKANLIAKE